MGRGWCGGWSIERGGGAIIQVAKPRCAVCAGCAGLGRTALKYWRQTRHRRTYGHMAGAGQEGGHMKLIWGDIRLGDPTLHLHKPGPGNR